MLARLVSELEAMLLNIMQALSFRKLLLQGICLSYGTIPEPSFNGGMVHSFGHLWRQSLVVVSLWLPLVTLFLLCVITRPSCLSMRDRLKHGSWFIHMVTFGDDLRLLLSCVLHAFHCVIASSTMFTGIS